MRKLRMDPDALRVQSFGAAPEAAAAPGTVCGQDRLAGDLELGTDTGRPLWTCTCTEPGVPFTDCCPAGVLVG